MRPMVVSLKNEWTNYTINFETNLKARVCCSIWIITEAILGVPGDVQEWKTYEDMTLHIGNMSLTLRKHDMEVESMTWNALSRTGGSTPPYNRASGIYWRQRVPWFEPSFVFYMNGGWSALIKSDPQPVIYLSSYCMLLLSWTRWRHNASDYKGRYDLPFIKTRYSAFALLADQSYSHAFHRARCNGLSGACLAPATQQLLSRTITVAAYKARDEPCVAAPPSPNAPLLDGEEYLCSFSHEDLKQK